MPPLQKKGTFKKLGHSSVNVKNNDKNKSQQTTCVNYGLYSRNHILINSFFLIMFVFVIFVDIIFGSFIERGHSSQDPSCRKRMTALQCVKFHFKKKTKETGSYSEAKKKKNFLKKISS